MNELTLAQTAAFLRAGDRYAILTHKRPDGDTVGCAALLCRALRALGKRAWVLRNPEITPKYRPYVQGLTEPELLEGQTLLSVDVAAENMFPRGAEGLTGSVALLLDHHGSNTGFAPRGMVRPEAAACAELILDLTEELGVKLDKPMAEAAYVGLSTDTGCFRYANTTANTLRRAGDCLAAGADAYTINRILFEQVRFPRLRLNGYLAEHVRFYAGGKVALVTIPKEVERELGVTTDDMDDVAAFPRNIEGVEVAATLREMPEGGCKMSLRAAPGYNMSAVCAHLGGGGHPAASGATYMGTLEEAAQAILKAMEAEGIEL